MWMRVISTIGYQMQVLPPTKHTIINAKNLHANRKMNVFFLTFKIKKKTTNWFFFTIFTCAYQNSLSFGSIFACSLALSL